MPGKTYIDDDGYLRFNDSNDLVHRWVAYKFHYKYHKFRYPMKFKFYQIHHKNNNKLDNRPENLMIVTKREHESIHNIEIANSNIFSNLLRFFSYIFKLRR